MHYLFSAVRRLLCLSKTPVFSFKYKHLPQRRSSAPLGQSLCPLHCKACGRHSLVFPHGKCPRRQLVSSFTLLACSAREIDAGMSEITNIRFTISSKCQLSNLFNDSKCSQKCTNLDNVR